MTLNLQDMFLKAFAAVLVLFSVLWLVKRYIRTAVLRAVRESLCFASAQVLLNLVFLISYVFYVKNGTVPDLSDMSVGFTVICPVVFFVLWRYGAFSPSPLSLITPALYSGFLVYRFFASGTGLGFFGYLLYNPLFGLIGAGLTGKMRLLGAVSALLPFACAALGRGVAVKRIDKRGRLCNNANEETRRNFK